MKEERKIYPLSKIGGKKIDSVEKRKESESKTNMQLLQKCQSEWYALSQFREDRARASRYVYGDQWGDKADGANMTERQYIEKRGNAALQNNLIRRLVNNIVGTYTKQQTEPRCSARDRDEQRVGEMMSITLQYNWQSNKMPDILSTMFEEFCVSGMAIARTSWDYRNGKKDSYTDLINPNYIFFSSGMIDPRHTDIDLIGQIHDISYKELLQKFTHKPSDINSLKAKFSDNTHHDNLNQSTDKHNIDYVDFYTPVDQDKYRVYEIWNKESKSRYRCHDRLNAELYKIELNEIDKVLEENKARIKQGLEQGIPENEVPTISIEYFIDNYWCYCFLTPTGEILEERETPYWHKSHPYTIKLYPFVNGEIHSVVADVIDSQRYINRMITLNDFIIKSGAKGVLMVDERHIPDGMSKEDFMEQWTSVDGVIFYTAKNGIAPPQQISKNLTNIGTQDVIKMQAQFMEEISGVHGASMGKTPYSGTSAALYAQQTANASTSLMNLLLKFTSFEEDIATKSVKVIQQYYTDKRRVKIAGSRNVVEYNPQSVSDVEFDLSIEQSASTPVYRMVVNDMLKEMWQNGSIDVKMYLKHSALPFADTLIEDIEEREQQAQAQQAQIMEQQAQQPQQQVMPQQ